MARKVWGLGATRHFGAVLFTECSDAGNICYWIDVNPTGPYRIEYEEVVVPPTPPTPTPKPSVVEIILQNPVLSGRTVTVNGRAKSSAPGCEIEKILWNWGDGVGPEPNWFPAKHTYAKDGFYIIAAQARDICLNTAMRTVDVQIGLPAPTPPPEPVEYIYKKLPQPDPRLHDEGITLYQELDEALYNKDIMKIIDILRRSMNVEQSPIVVMGIILSAKLIIELIVAALGSYGFAKFLYEEALQTIDMAIWQASKDKQWDLAEKALTKKREILDIDPIEFILELIPLVNVVAAVNKFKEASSIKWEIDAELIARHKETEEPRKIVSIDDAAKAIDEGKDPNPYLPTDLPTEPPPPAPEKKHELIKVTVRDIIDGDTLETELRGTDIETDEVVKLPEYLVYDKGTGKARIRIVGINAPEKSPKGEILCTDIEVFKVEKKYADVSRDVLLPLNDKTITLKVDADKLMDSYGRILAVVDFEGVDIGLRQIQEGLACWYFREKHKYVDDDVYEAATLKAKADGVGMWKEVEEKEDFDLDFSISIDSEPTRGKVYVDDVYTHHLTPSNEAELSDVMHLIKPGMHTIKVTKANLMAAEEIEILPGANLPIMLTLEAPGLPEPVEEPPEEIPLPVELPPLLEWTPEMRAVALAIITEVDNLTKGALQLSAAELADLKLKYGIS